MNVARYNANQLSNSTIKAIHSTSFYASEGFANLFRSSGGKPIYWVVEEDGKPLVAIKGIEVGIGPLKRFMSMPDGLYAPVWIAPEYDHASDELFDILLDGLAGYSYVKTFIYDFADRFPKHKSFEVKMCETGLVNIADPNWEPPDDKLRAQIRKAEREGISVVPFSWDRHHIAFLDLMNRTEQRHGRAPKYSVAFFEQLANLASVDKRVQWAWCEYESKPACSHIYFIDGTMLQGWNFYFDKAFSFLKPNQYISYTVCRESAKQGVTHFNLGGSPESAEGLSYYKKRWGGETYRYPSLVRLAHIGKLL